MIEKIVDIVWMVAVTVSIGASLTVIRALMKDVRELRNEVKDLRKKR